MGKQSSCRVLKHQSVPIVHGRNKKQLRRNPNRQMMKSYSKCEIPPQKQKRPEGNSSTGSQGTCKQEETGTRERLDP